MEYMKVERCYRLMNVEIIILNSRVLC